MEGFTKKIGMEQFHHFRKEDRKMGKVVQKPCLFTRQSQRAT